MALAPARVGVKRSSAGRRAWPASSNFASALAVRGARAALAVGVALVLAACGPTELHQVSDSGFGAYEVSLATRGDDGFAVAWYDTRDGNAEVYVRLLDAAGQPLGVEHRLTDTSEQSYEADIVALPDGFAVAWYEKTAAGEVHARLGAWSARLERRWEIALGNADNRSRNPIVRAGADDLFAAWIERTPEGVEQVRAAWFGFDGRERASPVVLGPAGETTWNLNGALGPGDTPYVVYDALAGTRAEETGTRAEEIFVATLRDDGAHLTRLTADDGVQSKYPDIAIAGAQFALTWFDERDGNQEVYLTQGDLESGLRTDALERGRRVTSTPGHSIGAYLAWNGTTIGLAWCDDTSGAHEVFFQSFAATGEPLGTERRLTTNATSSRIPAIKPWRDGFALAWNEVSPGDRGEHGADARSEAMFLLVR